MTLVTVLAPEPTLKGKYVRVAVTAMNSGGSSTTVYSNVVLVAAYQPTYTTWVDSPDGIASSPTPITAASLQRIDDHLTDLNPAYAPFYPAWVDSTDGVIPSATPITAAALQRMEDFLASISTYTPVYLAWVDSPDGEIPSSTPIIAATLQNLEDFLATF